MSEFEVINDTERGENSALPEFVINAENSALKDGFEQLWRCSQLSAQRKIEAIDLLFASMPFDVRKAYRKWRFLHAKKIPDFIEDESSSIKCAVQAIFDKAQTLDEFAKDLLDLGLVFRNKTNFNKFLEEECISKPSVPITFGVSHSSASKRVWRKGYRVRLSGLPVTTSWQDLKDHFRKMGEILFANPFKDGTGIVDFARYTDAERAVRKLDDSKFKSYRGESAYIRVKSDKSSVREGNAASRERSRSRSHSPTRRDIRNRLSRYSTDARSRSRSRSRSHFRD